MLKVDMRMIVWIGKKIRHCVYVCVFEVSLAFEVNFFRFTLEEFVRVQIISSEIS